MNLPKTKPEMMANEMARKHGPDHALYIVRPYLVDYFKDQKGFHGEKNPHKGYFQSVHSYLKKIKAKSKKGAK